jgi:hypothetical protein
LTTYITVISVIAAVGSFMAGGWVSILALRQAKAAEHLAAAATLQAQVADDGNQRIRHAAEIELVMHCADRWHEVRRRGILISDREWCEQFWGLYFLQFLYFDQGDIPRILFGLWMVELATLYAENNGLWAAHEAHLLRYSSSYKRAYTFYSKISEFSDRQRNVPAARDANVLEWVNTWQCVISI